MTAVPSDAVRVGVVGLGFMGRTHIAAYAAAHAAGFANRLVAVADRNAERRAGRASSGGNLETGDAAFDPTEVRGYESSLELIADPEVDLVSICTPTDSHVDLAIAALEAGKHVLVEKPVALESAEVARLAAAAEAASTLCMPAMCIRFWPGWSQLTEAVRDGRYGALRGVSIRRLAFRPDWSPGFYTDPRRSGGALFDLHVHDADLAVHTFGTPRSVVASGDRDHVSVLYDYGAEGPRVAIEGGWDHDPAFGFEMGYRAVFEGATLVYDLRREQPLEVHAKGATEVLAVEPTTGYDGEVRALLGAIARGDQRPPATVAEALEVTRVLEETARALTG